MNFLLGTIKGYCVILYFKFLVSPLSANDKELEEKELHMLELQEVYETCLLKMKVCVKLKYKICSLIGMSRHSTKHNHSKAI